eukprot:g37590.t1
MDRKVSCEEDMKCLVPEEVRSERKEVNGQELHLCSCKGKYHGLWRLLGMKVEWTKMTLLKADKGREGNMCLVVASCWRWQKWQVMILQMWVLGGKV